MLCAALSGLLFASRTGERQRARDKRGARLPKKRATLGLWHRRRSGQPPGETFPAVGHQPLVFRL